MSAAARSIVVFGIYLVIMGLVLTVRPNLVLETFGFPVTQEPWVRVLGFFMAIVGFYYFAAAREEALGFIRATVPGRTLMAFFLAGLGLSGIALPVLALFGVAELLGAVWTALALRSARTVPGEASAAAALENMP